MTHNIIAQFASSVWTSEEENRMPSDKQVGDFKDYYVISGSVFSEEYNETLDSATILLSQVKLEDRLNNIFPYQYVRVYDKSSYDETIHAYKFDKLYLLDNFNEKENNINEHIFSYTINLMSETKWLEKVQCPNLTITHTVNADGTTSKKTIYEYITHYMDLYIPKIKYSSDNETWSYVPLISYPGTDSDFYTRFNVPCADMGSGAFTLRQLLTMLMQQVGCIPVVRNRVLGFLDFQIDAQDFAQNGDYSLNNTVNFINRSLSSDSYVNTLVNMSSNVLDSENEVVCETLCFRDKSNLLLKQQENLYLETSFPIYKVNECILHAPVKYTCSATSHDKILVTSNYQCLYTGTTTPAYHPGYSIKFVFIYYRDAVVENGTASVILNVNPSTPNPSYTIKFPDGITFFSYNSVTQTYSVVETRTVNDLVLNSANLYSRTVSFDNSYSLNVSSYTMSFSNIPNNVVGFWFRGITINNEESGYTREFVFTKFADSSVDTRVTYGGIGQASFADANLQNAADASVNLDDTAGVKSWVFTPYIKENSVRNLLSRDFQQMQTDLADPRKWTAENITKYLYGTVGYSIGSKRISGFSEVYNVGEATITGWIVKDYTYIENIARTLSTNDSGITGDNYFSDFIRSSFANMPFIPTYSTNGFPSALNFGTVIDAKIVFYNPNSPADQWGGYYFSTWFVDLYYQPLNSFNLAYVKSKEDVDISIAQYDGNASGLTDFDRLSTHEQEQVDRIGNETLFISQRTSDFNNVRTFDQGPLYFKDDTNRNGSVEDSDKGIEYVIFKYSYTVNNNCYNVNYTGSKDAILKDYFTSIRTKYRAYQYVDYSSSTLRKERDVVYVRIASDYYNGDDRIWIGNFTNRDNTDLTYWIYDLTNYSEESQNTIAYEVEYDIGLIGNGINADTEELQAVKNSVSKISTFNTIGLIYEYVDNVGAGTYVNDVTEDRYLGGLPQVWQIWGDSYAEAHTVSFTSKINLYLDEKYDAGSSSSTDPIKEKIKYIEQSPIVTHFIDMDTSNKVIFNVVEDNTAQTGSYLNAKRTFYKDVAETINHTVEFIYYAPNGDVLFDEDFIAGAPMIGRYTNSFDAIYGSTDFKFNKDFHSVPVSDTELGNRASSSSSFTITSSDIIEQGSYSSIYYIKYSFNLADKVGANQKVVSIDWSHVTASGGFLNDYSYERDGNVVVFTAIVVNNTMYESLGITVSYNYIDLNNNSFYANYVSMSNNKITITWNGYNAIKLCSLSGTEENKVKDIVVFKRPDNNSLTTDFYLTLNDTKTDYVLAEKDGVLYRKFKVKTNTLDRDVVDIDSEEESEDVNQEE